jgi:hypothetical protein
LIESQFSGFEWIGFALSTLKADVELQGIPVFEDILRERRAVRLWLLVPISGSKIDMFT